MKLNITLVEKLIRLRDGHSLPASKLRGELIDELIRDGIIVSTSHGSRRTLSAHRPDDLCKALSNFDERFTDLERLRDILQSGAATRSEQASTTGNSKLVNTRSCPGFPVNSYEPIDCVLNDNTITINPVDGSFSFIADWPHFSIPSDIIVVGIENMENFRMIRRQRQFFEQAIGHERLLFVSRYPQSTDLVSWLQTISNRYVHFGDFDLAGINIFITEFYSRLGSRSSFLIPSDIEQRLSHGSKNRYDNQYQRFHNLTCDIPYIQDLIKLIHRHHRCYDQEGYIG